MLRLAPFALLIAGAASAPATKDKSLAPEEDKVHGSLELVDPKDYSAACYNAWYTFDYLKCWCHTGCALDCTNGGIPGTKGSDIHPDWCGNGVDRIGCERPTEALVAACASERGPTPGLSKVMATGGYKKPPPLPPNTCAGKIFQQIPTSDCHKALAQFGGDYSRGPNCHMGTVKIGDYCEGDSECGTTNIDQCGNAYDVYQRMDPNYKPKPPPPVSPGCTGKTFVQVPTSECSAALGQFGGDYWKGPQCHTVPVGAYCEGDGECGTTDIDQCDVFDVYKRTS